MRGVVPPVYLNFDVYFLIIHNSCFRLKIYTNLRNNPVIKFKAIDN